MTRGDGLDLPKENSSYGDLTTWGEGDDAAIGHADVDGTIDGSEGESAQRRCSRECSSSKEGFDGAKSGAAIEGETIAVVTRFGDGANTITTAMRRAIRVTGGSGSQGIKATIITFLSDFDGAIATSSA